MEHENGFVCTGKVNLNDFLLNKNGPLMRGELEKVMYSDNIQYPINDINITLFDTTQPASTAVVHLDHFIKCMEMHLRIINRCDIYETVNLKYIKNDGTDLYYKRKSVCDLVFYIRTYLDSIEPEYTLIQHSMLMNVQNKIDEALMVIKKFLVKLRKLPGAIFHYAISNTGNKCAQPEFHLYHMHLDLRWLIVTVIYITAKKGQFTNGSISDLTKTLELVIDDLIYISLKIFDRISLSDLCHRSPFNCTCIRELWLMLQILIDDIHKRYNSHDFWHYANVALNKIQKPKGERKKFNEKLSRTGWHGDDKNAFAETRYPELFGIWMIYHLALLHGYNKHGDYIGTISTRIKSNYDEIDKLLKGFANGGANEVIKDEIDEQLKIIISLLRVLTEEWWPSKMMVINYLWECFHRRLEQPFLMQSGRWSISIEKKTPADILQQVKDRINGNLAHGNESSYGMFLRFLGEVLKRGHDKGDNKFWHQVKGRICSKFTKNKVKDFSESALINFISLFLTLAITTDAENVCAIMQDLLPVMQDADLDNVRCASLSWKGQLTILLVYTENKLQLAPITHKLIQTVNVISCRKDELARMMMAIFVDTLSIIISSNEKLDRGEHNLIGGWIDRYLLECSRNRAGIVLKMLLDIFNVLRNINTNVHSHSKTVSSQHLGATKMLEALWSVVASRIRTLVFDINSIGENYYVIAKLAVEFTLDALNNPPMAQAYRHSATSLFVHFTSTINVKDVRITKFYIGIILDDTNAVNSLRTQLKNWDLLIVQAWIKCCVYGEDTSDGEMRRIKSHIAELDEFKLLFPSWMDVHEFKESKESVLLYAMALAKQRNLISELQVSTFDARTRAVFNHIDKWALLPITDETKNSELAFWIYRCLGTFFLCCGVMFHTKSQKSPLKNYIHKFILPANEQMAFIKHLGKRIFSMVILGFEAANPKTDVALYNLMFDIFQTYLPLLIMDNGVSSSLKISESLIRCFTDAKPDFINFIIEILSTGFFKLSADNSMHKHSHLLMTLLTSLISAGTTYPKYLIEFIISRCGTIIIECYIKVHDLHPHKKQTLNFITKIVSNPYFEEDSCLRATFNGIILSVLSNYLCSNPQAIFEFLKSLTTIESSIVKFAIPHIEKIIVDTEKYHRPNVASLRYSLKQLEHLVTECT